MLSLMTSVDSLARHGSPVAAAPTLLVRALNGNFSRPANGMRIGRGGVIGVVIGPVPFAFAFRERPGDDLAGHEVWQSANTHARGLGGRSGDPGGRNPAIAVRTQSHRRIVNRLQNELIPNPAAMTPLENIHANLKVLRESQRLGVAITDKQIKDIGRRAVRFYQRMLADGHLG